MPAEAPPHPRDAERLEGVEAPAAEFQAALDRGRLHHAWLLTGPAGVGKASFAYRAAMRLLAAKPDERSGPLGAAPDDPVVRMVRAQSHPDLLVLEREAGKKAIPVDEARRLPEFFAKAPAIARFRVAIIDSADDLNVNAANAVLKTLEEPSGRGVLFLVSHAPGRLLSTIKSRCRRLRFQEWPDERLTAFVERQTGLSGADARRLAHMAHGAPGRTLSLIDQKALDVDALAGAILKRLPETDEAQIVNLTDGFRGGEGAGRFALMLERLADRIRERTLETAGEGGAVPERWAEVWERLAKLPGEAEALNLDRTDAFWTVLADMRAAARVQPLGC